MAKKSEMSLSPEAAAAAGIAGAAVAKLSSKELTAAVDAAQGRKEDQDGEDDEQDQQSGPAPRQQQRRRPALDYDENRADRADRADKAAADKAAADKAAADKAAADKAERDRQVAEAAALEDRERERVRERLRRATERAEQDGEYDNDHGDRYDRERERTARAGRGGWGGGSSVYSSRTLTPRESARDRSDRLDRSERDDDGERKKLDDLIASLPESERTSFCFTFRKMNPGSGKGAGGGIGTNCGIWYPIGDDWQSTTKIKLAGKYGPGFYEGTIRSQDGSKVDAKDKWTFFVTDEEAEDCGWGRSPEADAPPLLPATPSGVQQKALDQGEFDPEAEERKAVWIEKRIKTVEAEKRLRKVMGEEPPDEPKKKEVSDEHARRLVEAERRAVEAEKAAIEARMIAEREADRREHEAERLALQTKAENDKRELQAQMEREKNQYRQTTDALQAQLTKLAADMAESKRAPVIPPPDPLDIVEKVRSLTPDPLETMRSMRDLLPAPPHPEKPDYASAITALGNTFGPLIAAAVAKLNAPPPPPPPQPDVLAMVEAVARLMPKPEAPKQIDTFELLEKAKSLMPAAPKPVDPLELARQIKDLIPQQADPFAVLERARNFVAPPSKAPTKGDLFNEMQQMVQFANSLRDMSGGGGGDEAPSSGGGIRDTLEQIKALKELGIPIKVGNEEQGGGTAEKLMMGVEKALFAAGEAARRAGVFGGGQPEQDPAMVAEIQRQKLMRARGARQRQAAASAAAAARARGNQIGMQRPQPQPHAQRQMQPVRRAPPPQQPMTEADQEFLEAQRAARGARTLAARQQAAQQQAAQQQAAQQQAAQQQAASTQQQTEPSQRPPAQAPAAGQPTPEPASGTPTSKDWGELSQYVNKAIEDLVDPSEAALHMLEKWPAATMMIADAPSVGIVEMGLMTLSSNPDVGPFASIVAELASRIRVDPGRGWADHLLKALKH